MIRLFNIHTSLSLCNWNYLYCFLGFVNYLSKDHMHLVFFSFVLVPSKLQLLFSWVSGFWMDNCCLSALWMEALWTDGIDLHHCWYSMNFSHYYCILHLFPLLCFFFSLEQSIWMSCEKRTIKPCWIWFIFKRAVPFLSRGCVVHCILTRSGRDKLVNFFLGTNSIFLYKINSQTLLFFFFFLFWRRWQTLLLINQSINI